MKEDNPTADRDAETGGRLLKPKRRSVLQGLAALGLTGSAIGATMAQDSDGGGDSDGSRGAGPGIEESELGIEEEGPGVPVSIQLYTLRNLPDTVLDLIRRVGAVDNNGGPGYDAVEPAGLGEASVSEVRSALQQTQVEMPSAHVGLGELEGDSFQSTVETYTSLGVKSFVVPFVPAEDINTVQKVQDLVQRMNDVAARLAEYDARLGYHNHDQEFQELPNGQIPLEIFAENLDESIIFEIDVGWVLTAGYDPSEVISRYSKRTELIHMKDMENGEFREIGTGGLDLREIAQVAREEANVEALVYEHDEPVNPAASVATGAGVLSFLDGGPVDGGLECLKLSDIGPPGFEPDLNGASPGNGGEGPPPVVGDADPTDPDGDGLYEDVNGDGKVDGNDVTALFEHFEDDAVQNNPDAFDFNENSRMDYDDIVELSESM